MIDWGKISDEVLLQAHINHLAKITGKTMSNDTPSSGISFRVKSIKNFYEWNPELIPDLEEEIAKLVD